MGDNSAIGWWVTEKALRAVADDEVSREKPSNEMSGGVTERVRGRVIRRRTRRAP